VINQPRYRYRNITPVWILLTIDVALFIMTAINPNAVSYLVMTKPITNSHYWTVFTAMFIHASFSHIFFNMLHLYFFGMFCSQLIEKKWFLIVYLVGGIVGNLMFLAIGPMNSAVVGASGAVFALGGLLAVMRPRLRVYLYFFIPAPLWLAITIAFVLTAFVSGIAWQGHLGGLIVGLVVGYVLRRREQRYYHQTNYLQW
jgi:membrane associated rhomboid family serine protease